MKFVIAMVVAVLALVPAAFATGQALDPRVSGLQKRVKTLERTQYKMINDFAKALDAKVDVTCVSIVKAVIRPGYVYQTSSGQLVIYQAFDEFRPESGDRNPNFLMQADPACVQSFRG